MKAILENYTPKPLGEESRYAVFLPLIWDGKDWQVLYQVRSQHISQPGEVSFPGGRVEAGETYQEAALRETVEELNLAPSQIDIWGEIDYFVYQTRSIHCFVGQLKVDKWQSIKANEEVDRLFTVALRDLLAHEPTYYELKADVKLDNQFPFDRIRNGKDYGFSHQNRSIPFYEAFPENIWGMTAQFTHRFTEILKENNKKA
ncbi:NUDIX domain-containing protein [Streptococcus loxodontisalivarius]|uniref:NUDIX domain-containing protein n=1 Tax=Streptococcus loxodontisalivarius TaxID=1349415 RepID=UPI00195F8D29